MLSDTLSPPLVVPSLTPLQDLSEDLLFALRQHVQGLFVGTLPNSLDQLGDASSSTPVWIPASQEVAFQTLFQLQAVYGQLLGDQGKSSGTRGLLNLTQFAELIGFNPILSFFLFFSLLLSDTPWSLLWWRRIREQFKSV